MYYEFECGCKIPQFGTDVKEQDGLPSLEIDFYNINHHCPKTWELLSTGKTKGVFQLETNLGQSWSKKMKPENLYDIAVLLSIIRPGVLKTIIDKKSMTQHYIDRRNGEEVADALHPLLEPILNETHQIIVFQEQSMKISQEIAGFNLQEADKLRKAIGTKDPKIMTEVRKMFVDGCIKKGLVTEAVAIQIFDWIQESVKYQFNASHGVGYGETTYWTAYVKAHFPLHFYAAWLYWSKDKLDPQAEVKALVDDSKLFDIEILPPSIKDMLKTRGNISISKDGVRFGVQDIKRIGASHVQKILNTIERFEEGLGKPIHEWSWLEFLILYSDNLSKTVVNGLISVGALSCFMKSRNRLLFEYRCWNLLSEREKKWVKENFSESDSLKSILEEYIKVERCDGGPSNYKRKELIIDQVKLLETPPTNIDKDDPSWISKHEKELIGINLSVSNTETVSMSKNTISCKDFLSGFGKPGENIVLGVEITDVRDYKIRYGDNAGQMMAFLEVSDTSCSMGSVLAFSGIREKYKDVLYSGNLVYLYGTRSKKNDETFIINKIENVE